MEKVRFGIIGVGNISKSHIDGYKKDPRAELYAFCDIDPKRLAMMGKEYEVEKLYTDIDEMLALPELEAVSVCTWNNAHAECAIKAMKARSVRKAHGTQYRSCRGNEARIRGNGKASYDRLRSPFR